MKSTASRTTLIAGAAAAVFVLTGAASCNSATQPFKDAPRAHNVNKAPAEIVEMPDGFNNLATKCDHGHRIYTSYHGSSGYGFGFAIADPSCAGS